jgi:hypothetical protein
MDPGSVLAAPLPLVIRPGGALGVWAALVGGALLVAAGLMAVAWLQRDRGGPRRERRPRPARSTAPACTWRRPSWPGTPRSRRPAAERAEADAAAAHHRYLAAQRTREQAWREYEGRVPLLPGGAPGQPGPRRRRRGRRPGRPDRRREQVERAPWPPTAAAISTWRSYGSSCAGPTAGTRPPSSANGTSRSAGPPRPRLAGLLRGLHRRAAGAALRRRHLRRRPGPRPGGGRRRLRGAYRHGRRARLRRARALRWRTRPRPPRAGSACVYRARGPGLAPGRSRWIGAEMRCGSCCRSATVRAHRSCRTRPCVRRRWSASTSCSCT